jgi:hypothetical protein
LYLPSSYIIVLNIYKPLKLLSKMIKKSCKNSRKSIYCFIFILTFYILFSSSFITFVFGEELHNSSTSKNLADAKKYGENLFTSLGTSDYDLYTVLSYFHNEAEKKAFFEGFDNAWKDENKKKGLIENFLVKDEKGTAKVPDAIKIEILQHLSESSGEEHNKFLTEIAKQKIKTYGLSTNLFEGVSIPKNKIKDLAFDGTKLGVPNSQGKFEAWVDFDKIPRWTKKIELITNTVNGKEVTTFKFQFKTRFSGGTRTVLFSKGTIGPNGEIIGPDGVPIGSRMSDGIRSISLNKDGKFEVKYMVGDKEKTLVLENSELKKAISTLKEQLAKKGVDTSGVDVEEVLKKISGRSFTAGQVSGADSNGLVFSNQLNVLFGNQDSGSVDQIDISYDADGNPEIKTKGTASIVTTGFDGRVLVGAGVWGSADPTKEAILRYNKYGELKEAQNAMIDANVATVYAPAGKFTKIDIVENSIADAILRGDKKVAIEAALTQAGVVDKILAKGVDKSNAESEIMEAVFDELNKATSSTTFQNRFNEAKDVFKENFEKTITNLMTFGTPQEDLTGKKRLASDLTSEVESELRKFVENPDNLKALATGDKTALKTYLKKYVKSNPLLENLDAELAENVIGFSGKTPDDVKQKFQEYVDGPDFEKLISDTIDGNIGKDSPSTGERVAKYITENLTQSIKVGGKPIDLGTLPSKIGSSVDSLISDAQAKVKAERENFEKNVRADLETHYGTESVLRIDKSSGEIFAQGNNNNLIVEIQSTLNKVTVNPIGSSKITVYSYGDYSQPLAEFTSSGTSIPTTALANSYQVGSIVNKNFPNQEFTVQKFGDAYKVYDSKEIVTKFAGWGTATVVKGGIPLIGSISIPFNTNFNVINAGISGDIADNPNSKIEITYKPNTNWGPLPGRFFIGRLINRIIARFANAQAQKKPLELSTFGTAMQENLDKRYNEIASGFNGDPAGFTKLTGSLTQLTTMAQKNGVSISRQSELDDTLSILKSMSAGKQEYYARFQPIINALNSNKISYGQKLEITPTQIIAGGRVIYQPVTADEQIALRMFLRDTNPKKLTEHRTINM